MLITAHYLNNNVNNFLVLSEGTADDINGSIDAAEKKV